MLFIARTLLEGKFAPVTLVLRILGGVRTVWVTPLTDHLLCAECEREQGEWERNHLNHLAALQGQWWTWEKIDLKIKGITVQI